MERENDSSLDQTLVPIRDLGRGVSVAVENGCFELRIKESMNASDRSVGVGVFSLVIGFTALMSHLLEPGLMLWFVAFAVMASLLIVIVLIARREVTTVLLTPDEAVIEQHGDVRAMSLGFFRIDSGSHLIFENQDESATFCLSKYSVRQLSGLADELNRIVFDVSNDVQTEERSVGSFNTRDSEEKH